MASAMSDRVSALQAKQQELLAKIASLEAMEAEEAGTQHSAKAGGEGGRARGCIKPLV